MHCDENQLLFSALLDGEIAPADRAHLEEHLRSCSTCVATLEAERRQDAELRAVFAPRRQAVAAIADRVIQQIRLNASPVVRRRTWTPLVTSMLSAAAGFLAALLWLQPWQLIPPEKQLVEVEKPIIIHRDRPVLFSHPFVVEKEASTASERGQIELVLATGKVESCASGAQDWQELPPNSRLDEGVRVRTPPGVRCEFRCPDGSEFRLNGGTEVAVHSPRKLECNTGQVFTTVAKSETPFEVDVPDAKITSTGAEFDLHCRPAAISVLTVVDGRTRVESKATAKGMGPIVKRGEQATLKEGAIISQSQVHDLVKTTNWVHEILVLKGRNNPELERRINVLLSQLGHEKLRYLNEPEIRALGDHCVLPMTRFVQASDSLKETGKRQTAMRILADLAQPSSIPDLIPLLSDSDKQVRYLAASALKRLIGEDFEMPPERWRDNSLAACRNDAEVWQKWWSTNRQRYPGVPLMDEKRMPDKKIEVQGKE